MTPANFAIIMYQLKGRRYLMPVLSSPNLTALKTFAEHMQTVTPAGTFRIVQSQIEYVGTVEQDSHAFSESVDYYCNVILRCGRKKRGIPYPSPRLIDLVEVYYHKKTRYKLKTEIGEQIARWYSELSGETYRFVNGYLCTQDNQKTA